MHAGRKLLVFCVPNAFLCPFLDCVRVFGTLGELQELVLVVKLELVHCGDVALVLGVAKFINVQHRISHHPARGHTPGVCSAAVCLPSQLQSG